MVELGDRDSVLDERDLVDLGDGAMGSPSRRRLASPHDTRPIIH